MNWRGGWNAWNHLLQDTLVKMSEKATHFARHYFQLNLIDSLSTLFSAYDKNHHSSSLNRIQAVILSMHCSSLHTCWKVVGFLAHIREKSLLKGNYETQALVVHSPSSVAATFLKKEKVKWWFCIRQQHIIQDSHAQPRNQNHVVFHTGSKWKILKGCWFQQQSLIQ